MLRGLRRWAAKLTLANGAFLFFGLLSGYLLHGSSTPATPSNAATPSLLDTQSLPPPVSRADGVLVLYSYARTDAMSLDNLSFFVLHAMHAGDGAEYVVIANLQEGESVDQLPALPANARYMVHGNECYDWGTYAWALDQLDASKLALYKYFVFINSSVRGPLMPPYARAQGTHWTKPFTSKLVGDVKLVGPAISCEQYCLQPGTCRQTPHVQSVAVATDQVGLEVMRAAETVLTCHATRDEAIYHGEMGSSFAILQAGHNIDSFLTRYQDVDWRLPENKLCNAQTSPIGNYMMDGLTISAFELLFPKLKASLLETQMPSHVEAAKLSSWMSTQPADRNLADNWVLTEGRAVLAAEVLIAKTKGIDCFDWDYYIEKNGDLKATGLPREKLWDHFLSKGMLEYREHKWKCGLDPDSIIPTWP